MVVMLVVVILISMITTIVKAIGFTLYALMPLNLVIKLKISHHRGGKDFNEHQNQKYRIWECSFFS
jgi:ammonia channel protein AmtB